MASRTTAWMMNARALYERVVFQNRRFISIPAVSVLSILVPSPFGLVAEKLTGPMNTPEIRSLALVLLAVAIMPFVETALLLWLPMKLIRHVWKSSKDRHAILLSAALFGVLHCYSSAYVVATFIGGVVFAHAYVYYEKHNEKPVVSLTLIHTLRNAVGITVAYLCQGPAAS